LKLQARLGDYELIKPGRELIKEGELQKYSRNRFDTRYLILLSDYLLYTHYQGNYGSETSSLKVKYSLRLNNLQVKTSHSNEDCNKRFVIIGKERSFEIKARDEKEKMEWVEAISSAIETYRARKASFQNPGVEGEGIEPIADAKLGDLAPVWVPDKRVTMCQICCEDFTAINRRHHCRGCGRVICKSCSDNKAPLKYLGYDQQRVCDICYKVLWNMLSDNEHLRHRFKTKDGKVVKGKVPERLMVNNIKSDNQMSGYLSKNKNGRWTKCWFILNKRVLYTFRASGDIKAVEELPVLGWTLEVYSEKNMELYEKLPAGQVWELRHGTADNLRRHVFSAENDNLAEKWITALREATNPEQL